MDYIEALSFCESFGRSKSSMGLKNMRELLSLVGDPHKKGRFIHVAGTNGKGSVVSFITQILTQSGLKVGKFISPHLNRINERYSINGIEINDDDFAECVYEIHKALVKNERLKNVLTMFEIMTCVAFLYFYKSNCDIGVLETGLGGRFDATNVIVDPLLTVITMIGLDHTSILGDTIEKIAFEKACIMKNNSICVIAPQKYESALDIFKEHAKKKNTKVVPVDKNSIITNTKSIYGQNFTYKGMKGLVIGLLGDYQTENAATAIEAVLSLDKYGIKVSTDGIYKGLKESKWPGRLELINGAPLTFIDGAHNVDGVKELSKFFKGIFKEKKITYLFGVMKDKDYKAMIREIKETAKEVYLIKMHYERAEDIITLSTLLKDNGIKNESFESFEHAINYCYRHLSKDDIICIFGSLYLAGEAREYILNNEG